MRLLPALALLPGLALAAEQQARPQRLGAFQSWTAATHQEGRSKVCYAFARPSRSESGKRDGVMLTVTERPNQRDAVILTPGYTYPRDAEVQVKVGATELPFYTAGSAAAARDGQAAIRAFRTGKEAVARAPGPGGRGETVDVFPLDGFAQAYDAILEECPARARKR
ncbi:MAG TPA: invasion associated locus B family protein [Crenalkalicoccus sp.]|nr:invasion associated locus B family protein [Crenalkalicoccus sp.]